MPEGELLLNTDTNATLQQVMQQALSEGRPRAIIATGDLAHSGGTPVYRRFLSIITDICDAPLLCLPGNHDLAEEMRDDKNVFVMGEEVAEYQGAYKVTQGLLQEFGSSRVIDTPITENGFAGLAIGASFSGLKPVVEFMTFNFSLQAMDHIINSAAKTLYMGGGQLNCPIVFRGPNGAAARVAAQHSQDLTAWFSHIPGLKVISPFSARDHKGLLKSAIRDPNPVIFLENEILYGKSFPINISDDLIIPIGKAKIVSTGKDVTIISYGIGMMHTLEAVSYTHLTLPTNREV